MKEENKHIDYQELIAKYLSGNASDAEVQLLEEWVLASPDHKQEFINSQQAWGISNSTASQQAIDVNNEWEWMKAQTIDKGKTVALKPKRSSQMIWRIAAAALVVLTASLWLLWPDGKQQPLIVFSESEIKEQQLTDGTQIALNQFSTATYEDNGDGARHVSLNGDAFFEVVHDANRPFIINTQSIDIEVLGTSFYVDSRENQKEIKVIVTSGTVAVRAGEQEIVLTKGMMGTYDKNNDLLTEKTNDDTNYLAWKNNKLVYDSTRLEQVVYDLNRTFHAKVRLADPGLNNCLLSATYEQKSLDAILRILEKTLTLKATPNGEEIVISGAACNE